MVGGTDESSQLRMRIRAQVAARRAGTAPATSEQTAPPAPGHTTPPAPGHTATHATEQTAPHAPEHATPPSSSRHRRPAAARGPHRAARVLVRLGVLVVLAAVAAALLRTYVIASYYIPSASMETTLHGCPGCNDDHILVDKLSYRLHAVHRGDVVVFNRPPAADTTDKVLIKRVIGLPGDRLTDRNGSLYVNGTVLVEPYVDAACQGGTQSFPAAGVIVPSGDVYVMGDNRCDSLDSRSFGPVAESSIIGRAFLIVWPLRRLHYL